MQRPLRPTQVEALAWAEGQDRVAFFMEMRLGKTIAAIRWAKRRNRVLVIAPSPVIPDTWEAELEREGISSVVLKGAPRTRLAKAERCHRFSWCLVTLGVVRSQPELLDKIDWDTIVVDESVDIKSPQSKGVKVLLRHAAAPRRCILSGLPAPENVMELCTQFLFLLGEFCGCSNYWQARRRFCVELPHGGWVLRGGAWNKILRWVHARSYTMTRAGAGVDPIKLWTRHLVTPTQAQVDAIQVVKEEWRYGEQEAWFRVQVETWLRRIAGGCAPDGESVLSSRKAKRLARVLGKTEGQKVVWAKYLDEFDLIEEQLELAGIESERLTGANRRQRQTYIDGFNAGRFPVVIVQVGLKYGLNLAVADHAFYYSLPWSGNEWAQSQDRIVTTDKDNVRLQVLLTKGTTDLGVYQRLRKKKMNAFAFMKGFLR